MADLSVPPRLQSDYHIDTRSAISSKPQDMTSHPNIARWSSTSPHPLLCVPARGPIETRRAAAKAARKPLSTARCPPHSHVCSVPSVRLPNLRSWVAVSGAVQLVHMHGVRHETNYP